MNIPRFTRRFQQAKWKSVSKVWGAERKSIFCCCLTSKWKNGESTVETYQKHILDCSHVFYSAVMLGLFIECDLLLNYFYIEFCTEYLCGHWSAYKIEFCIVYHTKITRQMQGLSDLSASFSIQLHSLFYTWLTTQHLRQLNSISKIQA